MDKYIFINIDMFSKKSEIFISSNTESPILIGKYTIEELPKVVVDLAHGESIYSIKIIGGSKFSQLIQYGIETNEITKYNENKIEIEVI
jgi:hypothetical protein